VASLLHLPDGARLRANPRHELVLFDRLAEDERAALAEYATDPSFYGVVRTRDRGREGMRAVDRETALLLLTLHEPGPLPSYARALAGGNLAEQITRLVADGLLEVELDGAFLSGAAALESLDRLPREVRVADTIARLSREAVEYAEALRLRDVRQIAERLYGYNRRPLTPDWRRHVPDSVRVASFLHLGAGGATQAAIDQAWTEVPLLDGRTNWIGWQARHVPAHILSNAPYKLYVSPASDATPDALCIVATIAPRCGGTHLKAAGTALGLLRPDKLIAYFPTLESLDAAAREIATATIGMPVQGVPFTSEIAGDGLLSWGMDPPSRGSPADATKEVSWRWWVANKLAEYLVGAQHGQGDGEPGAATAFAIRRLSLDGVDTVSWTPSQTVWAEHA